MANPKISVIIPAYNGMEFLSEAIQSVLGQTYSNLELIVVDDASIDLTADVVKGFDDPRVQFVQQDKNRGAVAARHTGVKASSGDIIAFLDQDDLFHPQKLETHVAYLLSHPETGATYNARFEIQDSAKSICGLWQPPKALTLAALVVGFPISPSDTVLRREWALRDEIWDDSFAGQAEHVIFNGHEIVFGGRLVLEGCQFGNVGRALNYRRYHSRRILKHLAERCKAELGCQEIIFADPRCPPEILALQMVAAANIYLIWSYIAFVQADVALGQEFLERAIELKPSLLEGTRCEFVDSWAALSAADARLEHEGILRTVFDNLPSRLMWLRSQFDWAVARGYLFKGTLALIWGKPKDARGYFAQAAQKGAEVDERVLQALVSLLLDYECEFGAGASQAVLRNLTAYLENISGRGSLRTLKGHYWVNRAFRSYHCGEYSQVAGSAFRGIANEPKFLGNRGVLAILFRSALRRAEWPI